MSDQRDPEPAERVFQIAPKGVANYEAEIAAWPYSGCRSDKVMSRKLIYRLCAQSFNDARQQAEIALQTVQAMHDIWLAKLVRIEEKGP